MTFVYTVLFFALGFGLSQTDAGRAMTDMQVTSFLLACNLFVIGNYYYRRAKRLRLARVRVR